MKYVKPLILLFVLSFAISLSFSADKVSTSGPLTGASTSGPLTGASTQQYQPVQQINSTAIAVIGAVVGIVSLGFVVARTIVAVTKNITIPITELTGKVNTIDKHMMEKVTSIDDNLKQALAQQHEMSRTLTTHEVRLSMLEVVKRNEKDG